MHVNHPNHPNNSGCSNAALLNTVYKNAKLGVDSIDYILPKVKSNSLKKDLAAQMSGYLNFVNRAAEKLEDIDCAPGGSALFAKIPSIAYMKLKMYVDDSDSHIVEVLIENSTEGLIEAQRMFNRCKNLDAEISQLGCETVYFEQKNINKLRNYL
jgi:hypothetical protein